MCALLLVVVASCTSAASTTADLMQRLRARRLVVGAHRGGSYRFAPDTMDQFLYAERIGVDVIELDLRATRDGVAIVKHDDALDRGSHCAGSVAATRYEAFRRCRPKWWARRPATFAAVLRRLHGGVVVNAELKTLDVIRPAVDLVRRDDAYGEVYFQAPDRTRYAAARARDPRVALLYAPRTAADLAWALALHDRNLLIIELHPNLRTRANIDRIHRAGMLASENAWHFGHSFLNPREFLWADCAPVFAEGIDIAVSENPQSCLRQRDRLLRRSAPVAARVASAARRAPRP